jgi:uncharacterized membrane protein YhaH (DUF805 family)
MNKNALNLGITMGVVGILLFLLMVVLEPGMVMLILFGVLSIVVGIVLPVIFIRKEREENNGFITFEEAFKLSFVGLVIGGVISVAFQMTYIQLIDPDFVERMTMQTLEMANSFMGGLDDETRERMLREQETEALGRYTATGMVKNLGIAILFYLVISLILGLTLQKKESLDTYADPEPELDNYGIFKWYILVIRKYAQFNGRSRRKEYWMFVIINLLISAFVGVVDFLLFVYLLEIPVFALSSLYLMFLLVPSIALTVRRLHDTGKSGLFILISLIPLIGPIILLILYATEGDQGLNSYGKDPKGERFKSIQEQDILDQT